MFSVNTAINTALTPIVVAAPAPVIASAFQITVTFNKGTKVVLKYVAITIMIVLLWILLMKLFPKIGRGGNAAGRVSYLTIILWLVLSVALLFPDQIIDGLNFVFVSLEAIWKTVTGAKVS